MFVLGVRFHAHNHSATPQAEWLGLAVEACWRSGRRLGAQGTRHEAQGTFLYGGPKHTFKCLEAPTTGILPGL